MSGFGGCKKNEIKKMTAYTQLRINDAHHMFWIFSSWCVKGGLGPCNSRLGTPQRGETEGMEGLI